jgi:hypothetical protein
VNFAARGQPREDAMSDKKRALCKWKREEYAEDARLLHKVVRKPRHVCQRCGRAARKKGWLCKPARLD